MSRDEKLSDGVNVNFERLTLLMKLLEAHVHKSKEQLVLSLNDDLGFYIPTTLQDPEGRTWPDPSNNRLAISFMCQHATNRRLVTGFDIEGYDELAGLAVTGSADDSCADSLHWMFAERENVNSTLSPMATAVEARLTKLEGWEFLDLPTGDSRIRMLVRPAAPKRSTDDEQLPSIRIEPATSPRKIGWFERLILRYSVRSQERELTEFVSQIQAMDLADRAHLLIGARIAARQLYEDYGWNPWKPSLVVRKDATATLKLGRLIKLLQEQGTNGRASAAYLMVWLHSIRPFYDAATPTMVNTAREMWALLLPAWSRAALIEPAFSSKKPEAPKGLNPNE